MFTVCTKESPTEAEEEGDTSLQLIPIKSGNEWRYVHRSIEDGVLMNYWDYLYPNPIQYTTNVDSANKYCQRIAEDKITINGISYWQVEHVTIDRNGIFQYSRSYYRLMDYQEGEGYFIDGFENKGTVHFRSFLKWPISSEIVIPCQVTQL